LSDTRNKVKRGRVHVGLKAELGGGQKAEKVGHLFDAERRSEVKKKKGQGARGVGAFQGTDLEGIPKWRKETRATKGKVNSNSLEVEKKDTCVKGTGSFETDLDSAGSNHGAF